MEAWPAFRVGNGEERNTACVRVGKREKREESIFGVTIHGLVSATTLANERCCRMTFLVRLSRSWLSQCLLVAVIDSSLDPCYTVAAATTLMTTWSLWYVMNRLHLSHSSTSPIDRCIHKLNVSAIQQAHKNDVLSCLIMHQSHSHLVTETNSHLVTFLFSLLFDMADTNWCCYCDKAIPMGYSVSPSAWYHPVLLLTLELHTGIPLLLGRMPSSWYARTSTTLSRR